MATTYFGVFGPSRRFYGLTTKSLFRRILTTAIQTLSGAQRVLSALEDRGRTPRRGRLLLHRWDARKPPNGKGRPQHSHLETAIFGGLGQKPHCELLHGLGSDKQRYDYAKLRRIVRMIVKPRMRTNRGRALSRSGSGRRKAAWYMITAARAERQEAEALQSNLDE